MKKHYFKLTRINFAMINNFGRDLRIGKIKNRVQFSGSFRGFDRININTYRPCASSNIADKS